MSKKTFHCNKSYLRKCIQRQAVSVLGCIKRIIVAIIKNSLLVSQNIHSGHP